ncbi:imelysin family protein [Algibacter lectus]|uniref:imelysin family protein n=1 Tax=Algibacter lectus TaxID=221126 RepID=UPI0026F185C5|nr:imelysin family protein [Algibacter lectus]MDO7138727.1 imelysin family protein [Algibacter lectus]
MIKKIFLAVITLTFIVGCSSSSSSDDSPSVSPDNFDRGALLTNLADNIIIPAYRDLSEKLTTLTADKDAFIADVNQTNLDNLRASWLEAYKVWQHVEMFNIGKAEELTYSFQMNIYPVSTTDVEANISAGNADLTHVNNNDAVGFPAVDYMLYGVADSDAAILTKYEDDKYKAYLSDLVNQMESLTETVLTDWTSSYRATFVSSTSNTVTSSLNKFVNDYIFYFEKSLRANKFGIPGGVFSTDPLPEKVEAFYNQEVSKTLALEALAAFQNTLNGTYYSASATGESFKTYLTELERTDLSTLLNTRIDAARAKVNLLDDNFYSQVNSDNVKMTEAYDALQLVVVSLKVDMLQAFNVSVDYVDADGD